MSDQPFSPAGGITPELPRAADAPETRPDATGATGEATAEATTPWRPVEGEQPGALDQLHEGTRGGSYPTGDLQTEVWDKHPNAYEPPSAEQKEALQSAWERSKAPEDWAQHINPDRGAPGRANNCNDCTRAVESTWRGEPQAAGAGVGLPPDGESPNVTAEWAQQRFEPTTVDDVGARLDQMGPGSSAMLATYWNDGGGHQFNAVNDQGTVRYIDGQTGEVGAWPPPWAGDMGSTYGIFRGQ